MCPLCVLQAHFARISDVLHKNFGGSARFVLQCFRLRINSVPIRFRQLSEISYVPITDYVEVCVTKSYCMNYGPNYTCITVELHSHCATFHKPLFASIQEIIARRMLCICKCDIQIFAYLPSCVRKDLPICTFNNLNIRQLRLVRRLYKPLAQERLNQITVLAAIALCE